MPGVIDWDAARARLERVRRTLEETADSASNRERVFRRRAELLARPALQAGAALESEAIMTFRVGGERYGLELNRASEVITEARLAPVPGAPPRVAGVIQVRGEIRPVYDLAVLLGLKTQAGDGEAVVLVPHDGREIGVRTGRVDDIRHIDAADRRPAPGGAGHAKWLTADLVTVLNMDSLLEERLEDER